MERSSELSQEERARFEAWKNNKINTSPSKPEAKELKHFTIEQAYEKAKKTLSVDTINPESFEDLYGQENVENDIQKVSKLQATFEREGDPETLELKKYAKVLEAIIHEHSELSDWFGPSAHSIRPALYDDIFNGVDEIIEFRGETAKTSQLALAIDVTFSKNVDKKLKDIRSEILQDKLAQVKYFESEHMGYRGELNKVARVIISVKKPTVEHLTQAWMNGENKRLGRHSIQYQILEEIRSQLYTYYVFAVKRGKHESARVFKKSLAIMEHIIDEKGQSGPGHNVADDGALERLKQSLSEVFNA